LKIIKVIGIIALLVLLFLTREKSYFPYQVGQETLYPTDTISLSKWSLNEAKYDSTEIVFAQKLSKNEIGIQVEDSAYVKLEKIGRYLILKLHHQLGSPKDSIFSLTPWNQYQAILNKKSEFYCTQYSAMFAFFCRVNHIATREIECKGKNDRHIFNESYLPETNEWVFTDLTNGIISIRDERHHFLNLIELYNTIYTPKIYDYALAFSNDTIQMSPLFSYAARLQYNFDNHCRFYFYTVADLKSTQNPLNKFKRYFLNQPYFYTYSRDAIYHGWIFIKYISLILIVGLFASLFKHGK
jgi:hypothetical protein